MFKATKICGYKVGTYLKRNKDVTGFRTKFTKLFLRTNKIDSDVHL